MLMSPPWTRGLVVVALVVLGACDAGPEPFQSAQDALSVSNRAVGTISMVDPATRQIRSVLEVGQKPAGRNTRWRP